MPLEKVLAAQRPANECRTARAGLALSDAKPCACGEGAVDVGPQVFDVFAADAEAEQTGRDVVLARKLGPALDGRLHASDAGGMGDDLDPAAHRVAGRSIRDLEAQHRSEPAHLAGSQFMLRMRRQTRIADAADRRMYGQPTGEFARGLLSLTQANGESAGAAQGEEALEGARGGAGDLAAANQSGVISRGAAHDDAEEQVGVAADELGRAVHDVVPPRARAGSAPAGWRRCCRLPRGFLPPSRLR